MIRIRGRDYYTTDEVKEILCLSYPAVINLIKKFNIPKRGTRYYLTKGEVQMLLDRPHAYAMPKASAARTMEAMESKRNTKPLQAADDEKKFSSIGFLEIDDGPYKMLQQLLREEYNNLKGLKKNRKIKSAKLANLYRYGEPFLTTASKKWNKLYSKPEDFENEFQRVLRVWKTSPKKDTYQKAFDLEIPD